MVNLIKNKGVIKMTQHITVNEQSSIRIDAGKIIYSDPFHISGSPNDADIVLLTHEHFDHFSPKDIKKVAKEDTYFILPKSMKPAFEKAGLGGYSVSYLSPDEKTEVLGITIEAVPAYNKLKPFHPKHNGWLGYVVDACGERIYICGDTDDTKEGRSVKCDIVCVPIGGTFTMTAAQAAEFVRALSPKAAIPIHYGTIVGKPSDADAFEKALAGSLKVVRKIDL